jgi:hypothetical protein
VRSIILLIEEENGKVRKIKGFEAGHKANE